MKQSKLYLILCVLGVIGPWAFLLAFLTGDASIPSFFISIFVNHVASAVAADLFISAIIFLIFVFKDGRQVGLTHLWVYIPATFLIGLSFGLPLYLYNRARLIENNQTVEQSK